MDDPRRRADAAPAPLEADRADVCHDRGHDRGWGRGRISRRAGRQCRSPIAGAVAAARGRALRSGRRPRRDEEPRRQRARDRAATHAEPRRKLVAAWAACCRRDTARCCGSEAAAKPARVSRRRSRGTRSGLHGQHVLSHAGDRPAGRLRDALHAGLRGRAGLLAHPRGAHDRPPSGPCEDHELYCREPPRQPAPRGLSACSACRGGDRADAPARRRLLRRHLRQVASGATQRHPVARLRREWLDERRPRQRTAG